MPREIQLGLSNTAAYEGAFVMSDLCVVRKRAEQPDDVLVFVRARNISTRLPARVDYLQTYPM